MSKYDDATPEQIKKLKDYFKINAGLTATYGVMILIAYIGIFMGVALIMIPNLNMQVAGFYILTISFAILMLILYFTLLNRKRMYLIFGVERDSEILEEIFDIKPSDVKKLRRGWIKK